MTGLDSMNDTIIEIATIITDSQLDILEEGPVIAIYTDEAVLNGMDEWNRRTHAASGLLERVRNSAFTTAEAERLTLEFVKKFVPADVSPMCGNSICQDRRFLARRMPALEAYFHYRNLDVSTLKILVNRWAGDDEKITKKSTHLALEDIRDSIDELKFYRNRYLTI